MFCRHCGEKTSKGSKFCSACGKESHLAEKQTVEETNVSEVHTAEIKVAKKHVKDAVIVAIICGVVTLLFMFLYQNYYSLVDVVLIAGLAYGISKYNRVCGVIMVIYFIVSKILTIEALIEAPFQIIIALAFIYYFWQGMVGTFNYHKYK